MYPYKLQAMALLGQAGGIALIFAIIAWAAIPVRTGGMDWEHSRLTWVGAGVPAVLMIWAHIAVARQLMSAARREAASAGAPSRS